MSELKIFYLCDGKACDNPCQPNCKYTSKIEHASYWERETLVYPGKGKDYANLIPVSWIDEWSLSKPDGTVIDMLSDWIEEQRRKWNPLGK